MYYRVFAMNSHGSGAVSTWESWTTKKITVPAQVMFPDPTSNDPTMINLRWTAPENGGAEILGYCILAVGPGETAPCYRLPLPIPTASSLLQSEGPGTSNVTADNDNSGDVIRIAPATTYVHEGLRAKQTWNYRVYAVNEHGHSATASDARDATTADARRPLQRRATCW